MTEDKWFVWDREARQMHSFSSESHVEAHIKSILELGADQADLCVIVGNECAISVETTISVSIRSFPIRKRDKLKNPFDETRKNPAHDRRGVGE